jgi:hypothetical protein
MPIQVVDGAVLTCSFGTAPSRLTVLPTNRAICASQPAATILDHAPLVNIMSFGMCTSLANPQVAAATSAALGVLTPQPCVPATASPWAPGAATAQIAYQMALDDASVCLCNWLGVVTISSAGQATVQVP